MVIITVLMSTLKDAVDHRPQPPKSDDRSTDTLPTTTHPQTQIRVILQYEQHSNCISLMLLAW